MADARVTATEVKAILDNCTVSDTIVDTFILSANLTVTSVFASDTTASEAFLKEIERWFTAHMISSTLERTTITEKIGEVSVKYAGEFKQNLSSTPYGQMVMQIDVTGKMNNLGKRKASIYAVKSFE
jgi:hypothetical protein